jgi:hypothetical protein
MQPDVRPTCRASSFRSATTSSTMPEAIADCEVLGHGDRGSNAALPSAR